jgi:hypothetical protein
MVTRQTAEVEVGPSLFYTPRYSILFLHQNYMNSVERRESQILWYLPYHLHFVVVQYVKGDTIPQEAPHEIEDRKPPPQWPEHGAVEFNDVKMSYRPGLPNVLKGISVKVRGGEKIGVVGRSAYFHGIRRVYQCYVLPEPVLESRR